jgi:hypothetical protein
VEDMQLVEGLETPYYLDHDLPDVLLLHELLVVLTFANALEDVTVVCELHHDAAGRKDRLS